MRFRVAHFADLHVRGLARHDEIRVVIEAMCFSARERAVDAIVFAGDLWHSKASGLTPEAVELMTWIFRSLATVAPVHVVLGNHDGVLTNLSRQDAISPIVGAMNDPRVRLYKRSGTYPLAEGRGVYLNVYSVFDSESWDRVKPKKPGYNIAVYHGPVAGAESETGWALEAPVSVKWFEEKGFDLVLLGDIHKKQFLGYREQRDTLDP